MKISELEIRQFEECDRKAVIDLWQECSLTTQQNNPNKDINRKMKVNPELFLVGCVKGELVATVMGGYEGHRGWINYLAVKPAMQRQGLAKQLMQFVEEKIAQLGCPKINLQVRSSNSAVIDFYAALGYGDDRVIGLGKRLEKDC
ncbi:GNAT family acetyltransferase [Reinekea sp.]|uniref:GNAT family acetyltransferase n=1 Tax=Reinekea sp. TaxID=1970455 RepID=UPI0039898E44